jgi:hypothetical protein
MSAKSRIMAAVLAAVVLTLTPVLFAQAPQAARQSGVNIHRDGWDKIVPTVPRNQPASGPAPVRDLSGIWEPTPGYRDGVFATGPREFPSDGKPEHELPFTALGKQTWMEHKPGFGVTAVPIAENNDPFDTCDPIGFPRIELFNLRAIQIWQNKNQTQITYQNSQAWRNIWHDGRVLPKEVLESRWFFRREMDGRLYVCCGHDRAG